MTSTELAEIGLAFRNELPPGFVDTIPKMRSAISRGEPPDFVLKGVEGDESVTLRRAVMAELKSFLCTTDPRYDAVRNKGNTLSQLAVGLIAGFVASSVGMPAGVALAAVAYLGSLVLEFGTAVFCRLMS